MKALIINNPLIQRYRYATLRPKQLWVFATIYIAVTVLLLITNYSDYHYEQKLGYSVRTLEQFHRALYYQFLAFQIFITFFWSTFNSGSAIKTEILEKTYDFFKILPIPAFQKALGILIGKNLLVGLLSVINVCFLITYGIKGQINNYLQIQILLTIIAITILVNSTTLLSSITFPHKNKRYSSFALIILALFIIIPIFINAMIFLSGTKKLETYPIKFFNTEIPVLILITLISVYYSCWAMIGLVRKFNRENLPVFSRPGAVLFFIGTAAIVLGLFYPYLQNEPDFIYGHWFITFFVTILISAGSLRSYDLYLEHSRSATAANGPQASITPRLLLFSNIALGLGLILLWMASAVLITILSKTPLAQELLYIAVLTSFFIVFLALIELRILYLPISKSIGILVGFVAVLYLILPPIFSEVFNSDTLYLHGLFGFMGALADDYVELKDCISVLAVNGLLFAASIPLLFTRYNNIVTIRKNIT